MRRSGWPGLADLRGQCEMSADLIYVSQNDDKGLTAQVRLSPLAKSDTVFCVSVRLEVRYQRWK